MTKQQSNVNSWASNARSADQTFNATVAYALEQFENGNHSELAKLICVTNGKTCKGIKVIDGERLPFAAPLRRVLLKAFVGVTMKFNKNLPLGVKFTKNGDNAGIDNEVIEALRVLGKQTYRSEAFKEAFPAPQKKQAELTLEEKQKRARAAIKRFADASDMTFSAAQALFSAVSES
jgi:hypothetical protein